VSAFERKAGKKAVAGVSKGIFNSSVTRLLLAVGTAPLMILILSQKGWAQG
jgi:hypothetical protein